MIGEDVVVTSDEKDIRSADRIILPGVGAFEDAARKLKESGLDKVVIEHVNSGKPLMGICLGMQMLFEKSFEYGEHSGLGLIKGEVRPMLGVIPDTLKIPHMGWNKLDFKGEKDVIFKYLDEDDFVYFVHSFSLVHLRQYLFRYAKSAWKGYTLFSPPSNSEKVLSHGVQTIWFCYPNNQP